MPHNNRPSNCRHTLHCRPGDILCHWIFHDLFLKIKNPAENDRVQVHSSESAFVQAFKSTYSPQKMNELFKIFGVTLGINIVSAISYYVLHGSEGYTLAEIFKKVIIITVPMTIILFVLLKLNILSVSDLPIKYQVNLVQS